MAIRNKNQSREGSEQLERLKKLWIAVVKRAIEDLFSSDKNIKNDANWYIFNDASDFKNVCEILDLDLETTRIAIKNMDIHEFRKNGKFLHVTRLLPKKKKKRPLNG